MKKLTLDLDDLQVESFESSPIFPAQRGSVDAHMDTEWNCPTNPVDTMYQSCLVGSCDCSCESCNFSCDETCGGDTCSCPWTDP